jgi:hypothetical protein
MVPVVIGMGHNRKTLFTYVYIEAMGQVRFIREIISKMQKWGGFI